MALKKIAISVPRTNNKALAKALEAIRKALQEIYQELERLEKQKQDT